MKSRKAKPHEGEEGLFDWSRRQRTDAEAPLAARMRPRTLDEFIGQEEIVGPGRLLRRAIQADQLSSLIFHGPPGTGKTTLAQIIANTTKASFIAINAVLAGVKDIRESIDKAKETRAMDNRRTILFVDEVHRFNKAQQDALLPWVENGTVILIGATTENPYFEVNKALVSRSRIFQLRPLGPADLEKTAAAALADPERGYGKKTVRLQADALAHLVNVANGDARALLNALELAVETTEPDDTGTICVDLAVAEESIQRRAVLYDKEGDAHFDTISAFIKSVRGSDPDAALYWLARMVYAGEDPGYILRRMLILACEDIGLADPDTLTRVEACAAAFDRVGLPEGRFHLAQATLVLANAPKSNSSMGFFDALNTVAKEREGDVPNALKDKNRDAEGFGHGAGYLYPHAYKDHWVEQQYLPSSLRGRVFYQPSDQGYEGAIRVQVTRRREAQLAAMVGGAEPETFGLTRGPKEREVEKWIRRASDEVGRWLGEVRDRIFTLAEVARHHLVLDANAATGFLTWEAVRRAPEGGVVALASELAETLREQVERLPALTRPRIIESRLADLPSAAAALEAGLGFDRIVGYRALGGVSDKPAAARSLAAVLRPGGIVVLAEAIPRRSQRLYALADPIDLDPYLHAAWRAAEEQVYAAPDDPLTGWDVPDLTKALEDAGLTVEADTDRRRREVKVTPAVLDRWWSTGLDGDRAPYRARLSASLGAGEVAAIEAWARRRWLDRAVSWETTILFARCRLTA